MEPTLGQKIYITSVLPVLPILTLVRDRFFFSCHILVGFPSLPRRPPHSLRKFHAERCTGNNSIVHTWLYLQIAAIFNTNFGRSDCWGCWTDDHSRKV